MTPRATYRIQFHQDFPFARAEDLVPYFERLGISHLYASPITVPVPGSQHGYDVIDPTQVNPELGGEQGLRGLVAALRERNMGLIIDIVPNHMGIAGGHNPWWNDVLGRGKASDFARYFDIDWREPVLLPLLGAPLPEVLAAGQISLDLSGPEAALVVYGEHRLPLRPEDASRLHEEIGTEDLIALLNRQHYRLGWWRQANDDLNWRRFFTINELAGLRVEDDAVFEATHALYFRLWQEGLIDGVRIDHVDGLTDPAGYCRKLRARFDALHRPGDAQQAPAYIVVEKILAPGESLAEDWGVEGTSGYDFMEQASALLHDPAGAEPLVKLWHEFSGRAAEFEEEELRARQDMVSWAFEGQLRGCIEAFAELSRSAPETAGLTSGMLRRAITRLLWVFPVYRTYGTGKHAPASDAAIRSFVHDASARFTPPGEAEVVDYILRWLAGEGPGEESLAAEAVRRFQQLSAPIAAKAVEDTAFYRYGALLSRLDVGFDAARMAISAEEFHRASLARAERFPHAMLATATHDHKRGEDVRARLAVLSAIPDIWRSRVSAWDRRAGGLESGMAAPDRYALYQMLFGAWPDGLDCESAADLSAYSERLAAWQVKALREGKERSSWEAPDEAYEAAAREFIMQLLEPHGDRSLALETAELVAKTAGAALANTLVQTGLRYTVPGVPDCYQGCELPDFSMVDPDNRLPVDYQRRIRMLGAEQVTHPKLALIRDVLHQRRHDPALFAGGTYRAARVTGLRSRNVIAFERGLNDKVLQCAFALHCARPLLDSANCAPPAEWWGDTRILFGDGRDAAAASVFAGSPVGIALIGATQT